MNASRPATARQLRYLRSLADQRGETFAFPKTVAEASAEIERLKARPRDSARERRAELRQTGREMAERRGDEAAVRDAEISGYGSSARWRGAGGRG
jgi:hypothetical protein